MLDEYIPKDWSIRVSNAVVVDRLRLSAPVKSALPVFRLRPPEGSTPTSGDSVYSINVVLNLTPQKQLRWNAIGLMVSEGRAVVSSEGWLSSSSGEIQLSNEWIAYAIPTDEGEQKSGLLFNFPMNFMSTGQFQGIMDAFTPVTDIKIPISATSPSAQNLDCRTFEVLEI